MQRKILIGKVSEKPSHKRTSQKDPCKKDFNGRLFHERPMYLQKDSPYCLGQKRYYEGIPKGIEATNGATETAETKKKTSEI